MRFDVVTLFPEWVEQLESFGVIGRAMRAGRLTLNTWNPRVFGQRSDGRIDDRAYGGGPGMVMQPEPLARTIEAIASARGADRAPTVLLSPQGQRFDQARAGALAAHEALTLVCGRYEGVDQRVIDSHIDAELSVGDFVTSGGELPAMLVIDAVARLLDNVLGHTSSAEDDSFSHGLLEGPQYTRPARWRAREVPAVLQSGDHARIARWRCKQALGRTWRQRRDLLDGAPMDATKRALLAEYLSERTDGNDDTE